MSRQTLHDLLGGIGLWLAIAIVAMAAL